MLGSSFVSQVAFSTLLWVVRFRFPIALADCSLQVSLGMALVGALTPLRATLLIVSQIFGGITVSQTTTMFLAGVS